MITLFLAVVASVFAADIDRTGSIAGLGGSISTPTYAPFVVFFYLEKIPASGNTTGEVCTGSILSADWVLTAAHCFHDSQYWYPGTKSNARVISSLGSSADFIGAATAGDGSPSGTQARRVTFDQVVMAPDYVRMLNGVVVEQNDIALVRISPPWLLNEQTPDAPTTAVMYTSDSTNCAGTNTGYAIGFGRSNEPVGVTKSHRIPQTVVPCLNGMGAPVVLNPTITAANRICANSAASSPCEGDSGGPLLANRAAPWGSGFVPVVCGIVSQEFGGVCRGTSSGVATYTKVANYVSFIEGTTGIAPMSPGQAGARLECASTECNPVLHYGWVRADVTVRTPCTFSLTCPTAPPVAPAVSYVTVPPSAMYGSPTGGTWDVPSICASLCDPVRSGFNVTSCECATALCQQCMARRDVPDGQPPTAVVANVRILGTTAAVTAAAQAVVLAIRQGRTDVQANSVATVSINGVMTPSASPSAIPPNIPVDNTPAKLDYSEFVESSNKGLLGFLGLLGMIPLCCWVISLYLFINCRWRLFPVLQDEEDKSFVTYGKDDGLSTVHQPLDGCATVDQVDPVILGYPRSVAASFTHSLV